MDEKMGSLKVTNELNDDSTGFGSLHATDELGGVKPSESAQNATLSDVLKEPPCADEE